MPLQATKGKTRGACHHRQQRGRHGARAITGNKGEDTGRVPPQATKGKARGACHHRRRELYGACLPTQAKGAAWRVPRQAKGAAWRVPSQAKEAAWRVPPQAKEAAWRVPGDTWRVSPQVLKSEERRGRVPSQAQGACQHGRIGARRRRHEWKAGHGACATMRKIHGACHILQDDTCVPWPKGKSQGACQYKQQSENITTNEVSGRARFGHAKPIRALQGSVCSGTDFLSPDI